MSVMPNLKSTARKSTSRSALRVAMFRCGQYFSIRSCSALEKSSSRHKSDNEDVDDLESSSSSSAGENPPSTSYPKKFCCHLCPLICGYLDDFSRHLRREHLPKPATRSPSPTIEILRNVVDDIAIVPQQCGFCPYETMDRGNFSSHLRAAHGLDAPPLICCTCRLYASFTEVSMGRHYIAAHPGLPCRFETLALPFTMTPQEKKDGAGDRTVLLAGNSLAAFNMLPNVELSDVMKIPGFKLDRLLTENCLIFPR